MGQSIILYQINNKTMDFYEWDNDENISQDEKIRIAIKKEDRYIRNVLILGVVLLLVAMVVGYFLLFWSNFLINLVGEIIPLPLNTKHTIMNQEKSKEEVLLNNGLMAYDLKGNNKKVLSAMEEYANQFRTPAPQSEGEDCKQCKLLQQIVDLKEKERQQWADMCVKKQERIEYLEKQLIKIAESLSKI